MSVDGDRPSREVDFGAAVAEGRRDVEDEGKEDVAVGVDVAPGAVFAYRREAFGELVGFLEIEGDGEVAVAVDVAEATVLLDEGESVEVDIFASFGSAVGVLERKNRVPKGIDDAAEVAESDKGAIVDEPNLPLRETPMRPSARRVMGRKSGGVTG